MQARSRRIRLPKALKNVRKKFGFDADSCVGHADFSVASHLRQLDQNLSAIRRKLDCVRQQIPHNLLKPIDVARYNALDRFKLQFDANALCVTGRADGIHCTPDNGCKVDRFQVQAELPTERARYSPVFSHCARSG